MEHKKEEKARIACRRHMGRSSGGAIAFSCSIEIVGLLNSCSGAGCMAALLGSRGVGANSDRSQARIAIGKAAAVASACCSARRVHGECVYGQTAHASVHVV